tara:strand:+ start:775 stop:1080 length:306 start_codon:yes stop_codon:yes gene_type:complete
MSDDEAKKTENEYLELAKHCKDTIIKKDKELREMKDRYLECYKLLMMSYYVVRMGDSFLSDILRENPQLSFLVFNLEYMRGEISTYLDKCYDVDMNSEDDD